MKKQFVVLLLLVVPLFAQNAVEEAKTKIAKQKHELMVEHAKKLLERKAEIEAEMADINQKLATLESGKDVEIPGSWSSGITGGLTYTPSALGYVTGGGGGGSFTCTNCSGH